MAAAPTVQRTAILEPPSTSSMMDPASFSSDGSLDLDDTATELAQKWSVANSTRLTVRSVLKTGTWGTAEVLVRGGIDGTSWTTIKKLTGVGPSPALDVAPYSFVDIKVSVAEGSTGTAEFHGFGYSPPFDPTGPPKDFLIEVAKGNVLGHSLVHKFGRNDAVANATWEHISIGGGATSFLSAPTTVRIKAGGNAADTAAGAGAREITVVGIDSNLAEVQETIATAGASASAATTASFWRVYRAYVSAAGTYGAANTAAVVIENSAGGTDLITIATEEGQTQFSGFTVANATTAYLLSAQITVDAIKAADIRMYMRENFNDTSAPLGSKRIVLYWDGVLGVLAFPPRSLRLFSALTDIWFEAEGAGATTEVSVDYELLIVDD